MAAYLALVRRYGAEDYCVEFPDFPLCVAAASSLEEATVRARQRLACHIEGMIADGETVPQPGCTDAEAAERANSGAIAFLVEAAVGRARPRPQADTYSGENVLERFIAERMAMTARLKLA